MNFKGLRIIIIGLVLQLIAGGCVSKSKADARAREAFLEGQNQALRAAQQNQNQTQESVVTILGNVANPSIPWSPDLTLAKAILAASYRGARDPIQIVIFRNGQPNQVIDPNQLLNGQDFAIEAGDRISLR